MKTFLTLAFYFSLLSISISQEKRTPFFKDLFQPINDNIQRGGLPSENNPTGPKWDWQATVTIPALKVVETSRDGAVVDVFLLTSTGGGIVYQKVVRENETSPWRSVFAWSPGTILLSGNLTDSNSAIDIAYAQTIGFFDNKLQFGFGVDLGVVKDRSRFFGLLSIGININQN